MLFTNISNSPSQAAADCAAVAKLGGRGVRISIEQGWGDLSKLLAPYRAACNDHGLILMECDQPVGHVQPRSQKDQDAYGEHVAEACSICDQVSADNEWNGYGANEIPNPKACADTMLACIEARDRLAPGRTLLSGSTCPAGGKLGDQYVEPITFVRALLTAQPTIVRARNFQWDWHAYCDGRYVPSTPQTWDQCWNTRNLQKLLASFGAPDMKIVWSEFGTQTGPAGWVQKVSPATQALRLEQQIIEQRAQQRDGVHHGATVWYQLRDRNPASSSDWTACAGLLDLHGNPKPVAAAFTRLAA